MKTIKAPKFYPIFTRLFYSISYLFKSKKEKRILKSAINSVKSYSRTFYAVTRPYPAYKKGEK